MRALVLFVCLAVGCLAQRPKPCFSPPLLTGSLSVSSQSGKLMVYAKYTYDSIGQRIRLREVGNYGNKTFYSNVLLLYKYGVMYKLHYRNHTCCKKRLDRRFHPLMIPRNASFLGQAVLGSSSGPGQGVLVNTWFGDLHMRNKTAKYLSTVTEFGCIPISTLFYSPNREWVVTSFFNNVIGISEPQDLIPPAFCEGAQLEEEEDEEPETFFSSF
ncbi:ependymin-2 [Kryptolebias marmoratus]|uniref:Ependymin-2-like n=1 Tax=Kryptolebias marmoratus TaxID=37003 RepID=A0A3Q2ZPM2_KRYMA|nr:ependymin-2 [Kryptolebias marmoratus]